MIALGIDWWMGFFAGILFALCLLLILAIHVENLMGDKKWKRRDPKDDDDE